MTSPECDNDDDDDDDDDADDGGDDGDDGDGLMEVVLVRHCLPHMSRLVAEGT